MVWAASLMVATTTTTLLRSPRKAAIFASDFAPLIWKRGKPLWSVEQPTHYRDTLGYENGPRATPAIDGDHIYSYGVTGVVTCRLASTGAKRWSVDTIDQYGVIPNFFGVGSSPLVHQGLVILMVGGSPASDQDLGPMQLDRVSAKGSAIVALDCETGKEVWKCGEDLASYSSPRLIELGGTTFVLAFTRSGLRLIDPSREVEEKDRVRWKFNHRADKLESVNAMMPVVQGNQVFISECYERGSVMLEVTPKGVQVIWEDPVRDRRRQSMRCHWATPLLKDGFLYGCSGRNAPDSDFRCIDWATGKVQWSDSRRTRCSITRVGDFFLAMEERGRLQVIRPNHENLEVVTDWDLSKPEGDRPAIKFPCWAAPIVDGNRLLVRGDKTVLCLVGEIRPRSSLLGTSPEKEGKEARESRE